MFAKEPIARSASLLVAVLVLGGVAPPIAGAGPCPNCAGPGNPPSLIHWHDDRVVPMLPDGNAAAPDVAAPGDRFLVAYQSDASGLDQVYLSLADGIGCNWYAPLLVSAGAAEASRQPAVAATATDVVVVYARAGVVYARHAPLATWPNLVFEAEDPLSSTDAGEPGASIVASEPEVAAVANGSGAPQFFVVWEGRPPAAAGKVHVLFKKSLAAGASGTFTAADPSGPKPQLETDLIAASGSAPFIAADSVLPVVSADGFGTGGATAVSVGFVSTDMTATQRHLFFLRSADRGTTFFGDLASGSLVPAKVEDPTGLDASSAAIDSSDAGLGGTDNTTFFTWSDERRGNNTDVYTDYQAENGGGPPTVSRPFGMDLGAETGGMTVSRPQVAATAALVPGSPLTAFAYFVIDRPPAGTPDVHYRRIDVSGAMPALNCGGMNPLRLTGSFPARAAGDAQFPSAADALVGGATPEVLQLVAWVDTRSARPEIWWKSTDVAPPGAPTNLQVQPSACPVSGLSVSWSAPGDCDVSSYTVTYNDGSGAKVTTVPASQTSVSLANLPAGTAVMVSVVANDDACFSGAAAMQTGTTPSCPDSPLLVAEPPALPADGQDQCCTVSPCPPGDDQVDPNEIIRQVYLPIRNTGTGAATNVQASLRGSTNRVILPFMLPRSFSYPDVAAAGDPGGNDVQRGTSSFDFFVPFLTMPPINNCNATNPTPIESNPGAGTFTLDVTSDQIPNPVPLVYTFALPSTANGCEACTVNVQLAVAMAPDLPTFTDACAGGGLGNGDGQIDPGETLTALTLPIFNNGTTPATNINVVSLAPAPAQAGVVTIVQGADTYADIDPMTAGRNQTGFVVTLDPSFPCADLILDLTVMFDQRIVPQTLRYRLVTAPSCPGNTCASSCPAPIPAATLLHAVKSDADVKLDWAPEASASGGFNVWYVGDKVDIPNAAKATCTLPACQGVPGCSDPTPVPGGTEVCTHSGAVAGGGGTVNHYEVRAICGGSEGEH